jgi:hypothetical protein
LTTTPWTDDIFKEMDLDFENAIDDLDEHYSRNMPADDAI